MKRLFLLGLMLLAFFEGVAFGADNRGVSYDADTHVVAQGFLTLTLSNLTVTAETTITNLTGINVNPGGAYIFGQITNQSLNTVALVLSGANRELGSVAP